MLFVNCTNLWDPLKTEKKCPNFIYSILITRVVDTGDKLDLNISSNVHNSLKWL